MTSKNSNDVCYLYICISVASAYGISYLFNIDISNNFVSFFVLIIVFLILYTSLTFYISKNKKEKKPVTYQSNQFEKEYIQKLLGEKQVYGGSYSNDWDFLKKKESELKTQRHKELQILEEKLNKDLNHISTLLINNELKTAGELLKNCRRIAENNRFVHLKPKIVALQMQIDLRTENYKRKSSARIRKKILLLGTEADRILISEIVETTGVNDENLIIEVIKDMIKNEEIYAEFFESSKSILFNIQEKTVKIDKLLDTYKRWEEKDFEKKDSK
jgi:hypothetical protein